LKTTTIIRGCLAGAVGLPLLAAIQACGGTSAAQPATPAISAPSQPRATGTGATATGRSATPTRSAPASGRADPFGRDATAYVSGRTGMVTAAVYDVTTGQTWTFGSSKPQAEASVVKLNILEALYARHGSGLSESDTSLTREMMEDSDNDAATTLWYEAGGPSRIASFNTSAGLTHTEPSSCVQCPDFPWPGWGLSTTTPTDQLTLLRELIKPSALLTGTERNSALQLMENVAPSQRWGVSGGVPAQATVALKDGWLPLNSTSTDWQINSVGWVSGSGRNYLMAVLTTGNPSEQYGIDTTNQLGALVWQHLG
jgi:beta-lactamase class A